MMVMALVLLALLVGEPVATPAAPDDCIVLEDFARSAAGAFPDGWKPKKAAGRAAYAVRTEGPLHFLRASARNLGIQAGLEKAWDLKTYPVLRWKWRPRQFPAGADERTAKNDSAVGVYAVFPYNAFAPKTLKYIWSEKVPKGTELEASRGLTKMLVLESGPPADPARWVEERANVAEDYARRFADQNPPTPLGLAVLTDSDDTTSYAEGDYADFEACRP
jgi:DUF3047 family protein